MSASAELVRLYDAPDPYACPAPDLVPLQLQAISDLFREYRGRLPVLDQRAEDSRVEQIQSLRDVVPLLFPHSLYKSYPESFVSRGRWDRMSQWLGTVSTVPAGGVVVDVEGIADLDAWIQRLHAAGHLVAVTSGTSGKCALLNHTVADFDFIINTAWRAFLRSVYGIEFDQGTPMFLPMPSTGVHTMNLIFSRLGPAVSGPKEPYFLSDRPATAVEFNKLGSMRRAMIDGLATPSQIAELQEFAAQRQSEMAASLATFADRIVDHARERTLLIGAPQQIFQIMQALEARGVKGEDLHPESGFLAGGGRKADRALPADYMEQMSEFFGSRLRELYGMSELSAQFPPCAERRWHCPPTIALLVLDKTGEELLNPAPGDGGVVEGRGAFFDVALRGRWGGVITGDNITADFTACPCGRPGPTITRITRYIDLPEGDDKLTCAGTMDSYVRGVVPE